MWSYYGSKSKIVDCYPPPKYGKIIEPFAGSARYALKYWQRDVVLMDKDEKIVKLWKWLQQCSTNDLSELPNIKEGDSLDNYELSEGQKLFLSFCVNEGNTGGRKTVTKRAAPKVRFKVNETKKVLERIKHWDVRHGCYKELDNTQATWFIDPPYQVGGEYYKHSSIEINFNDLSDWCKERNGQVIVCENMKADWLPFKPLKNHWGGIKKSVEAIWSNLPTAFDHQQGTLFNLNV